eukprot:2289355-Alexandrium_andersonii.AAC.1
MGMSADEQRAGARACDASARASDGGTRVTPTATRACLARAQQRKRRSCGNIAMRCAGCASKRLGEGH